MSPIVLEYLAEWILLAGIFCAVFGAVYPHPWALGHLLIDMDKLGLAMLLLGALIEIRQAKKKVNKTQHYMEELRTTLKIAQQFGPAVLSFSDTIRETAGEAAEVHVHAAGEMLREHAIVRLPKLAQELKELRDEGSALELPGDFAPNLLDRLVKSVPKGGVLWGATHLTSEWFSKDNDDVTLHRIADNLCTFSSEGKLSVFRLYNLGSARSVEGLGDHINRELKAGIKVKILKYDDYIPDMTLIWNPAENSSSSERKGFSSPAAMLSATGNAAICGLFFDTDFFRYLRSVKVLDPKSNKFLQLKRMFEEAWVRASSTRIRKDTNVRRSNRPDRRRQAA
jgi:hypothetical protein